MNTVIKVSEDFRNFVSCENVNAWTPNADTTVSINTSNAYDGNAALNVTKNGTSGSFAQVHTFFPVSDFLDDTFFFHIYIANSTVLSSITGVEIILTDTLLNTINIIKAPTVIGAFAKISCKVKDFLALSGSINIGLINNITVKINTTNSSITWNAGDVIIDGFGRDNYIWQILNPKNVAYSEDLRTVNQLNFTLDIKDEATEYLNKWQKIELYAVENGIDELLWTGQIIDITANFTEVNVICYDEKMYFEKKCIDSNRSYNGKTVQETLQLLVEEQYTRNKQHFTYSTDMVGTIVNIDDMNALTGWSGNADTTLGLNISVFKQRTGSISMAKTSDTLSNASMTKTFSPINLSDKFVSFFVFINDDTLFEKISSIEIRLSDGTGTLSKTFDISLYGGQRWITLQSLINEFAVLSPTNITNITNITIRVNTSSALDTWGNNLLLVDHLISTTTKSTINPIVVNLTCNAGTNYSTILDGIVENLGGEWKIEKGRIIMCSTIGKDKTRGDEYVEFFSSALAPQGNSIQEYSVTDSGREMATALYMKTPNGLQSESRYGNTYIYGFLEAFEVSENNGYLVDIINNRIAVTQNGVKSMQIVPNTDKYDFRRIRIGDVVRVRIERGVKLLDTDQAIKVVQKSVQIANFTATYTITLMTENVRIRNAPNLLAEMQKRIQSLEINT